MKGDIRQNDQAAMQRKVARLVVSWTICGVSIRRMQERLDRDHSDALSVMGVTMPVSRQAVAGWQRGAIESIEDEQQHSQKTSKAMALAQLDTTIEPLMLEVQDSAASGRLNVRAVESLRKVIATKAEIQGVTRAHASLEDQLESALLSVAERHNRQGTIRSQAASPPQLRGDERTRRQRYAEPEVSKAVVDQLRQDRRPMAAAVQVVLSSEQGAQGTLDAVTRYAPHLETVKATRDRRVRSVDVGSEQSPISPDSDFEPGERG